MDAARASNDLSGEIATWKPLFAPSYFWLSSSDGPPFFSRKYQSPDNQVPIVFLPICLGAAFPSVGSAASPKNAKFGEN